MKAADVVTQLRLFLPQLTDRFSTEVPLVSLTRSDTTMTALCKTEHGLVVGDAVVIVGAQTQIAIAALTRSGVVGTLVTETVHDLTEGTTTTIEISGATESEFNDTFTMISIDNRKTITFTMADSGATSATGSPVLLDAESRLRSYDNVYNVSETPSDAQFRFEHTVTTLPAPVGTITARVKPRISAGIDPDRLTAGYTAQADDALWLMVVLDEVSASKNRNILSDAVDNLPLSSEFRQQVLQSFTLYLFQTVTEELSAADARDIAEDVFRPICQSVVGKQFDSQLNVGEQGPAHFVGHSVFSYDGATYVHAYSFEQVVDMQFEDTVDPDASVAFRDIDYTIDPNLGGTSVPTGSIDLDDDPL